MSTPVRDVERELLIRSMWPNDPPREVVAQLVRALVEADFRSGASIYTAGEPADSMYLISNGSVSLRADNLPPWDFDGSSFIGILDVMIGRPYTRTAVALGDIECERLPAEEYWDILEDDIEFTQDMLIVAARTLEERRARMHRPEASFGLGSKWNFMQDEARDLGPVERVIVLRRAAPFFKASADGLVGVTRAMKQLHLQPGDSLFRQGTPQHTAHVVARGQIVIEHEGCKSVAVRGPGDALDFGGAFARQNHRYSARAATPATVLAIEVEDLFDRMEEHFGLMQSVLGFIASEHELLNELEAEQNSKLPRTPTVRMTGDFDLSALTAALDQ